MTDKLITHEDFELALDSYIGLVEVVFPKNNNRTHLTRIETMKNYAKQQEQFAKDVARYFELANNEEITGEVLDDFSEIRNKLMKQVSKNE